MYKDASSLTATITAINGGNFEATDVTGASATAQIADTIDTTTVSLSATAEITEAGATVTYTATLTSAAQTSVTVTLSNGVEITIAAGETTGSAPFVVSADDDVYTDPTSISAAITTATGGNFENLVVDSAPAVTQIVDTIDDTTVSLSATSQITEAGAEVTYTATLTNAAQTAVTVTLSNGVVITIAAGETEGSAPFVVSAQDDVYVDPTSISAAITAATGGNFENFVVDSTPAVTQISDTIDTTTASIALTQDGANVLVTITLGNPVDTDTTSTVKFTVNSTEYTHTFAAGEDSYTLTLDGYLTANVYGDAETVNAAITEFSGGNFEARAVGEDASAEFALDALPLQVSLTEASFLPGATAPAQLILNLPAGSNPTEEQLKNALAGTPLAGWGTLSVVEGALYLTLTAPEGHADMPSGLAPGQEWGLDLTAQGGSFELTIGDSTFTINAVTVAGNNLNADYVAIGNYDGNPTTVVNSLNTQSDVLGDGNVQSNTSYTYTPPSGAFVLGEGNDVAVIGTMSGGRIEGNAGGDEITAGKMTGGVISGGDGVDTINVTGTMSGTGTGNSRTWIDAGAGNDTINVGTVSGSGKDGVYVDGGAGDDTINVDTMNGGTVFGGGDGRDLSEGSDGEGIYQNTITVKDMKGGVVNSGYGDDTITIEKMTGGLVDGAVGADVINLTSTLDQYTGGTIEGGGGTYIAGSNMTNTNLSFVDTVALTSANDTINVKSFDLRSDAGQVLSEKVDGAGVKLHGVEVLDLGDGNNTLNVTGTGINDVFKGIVKSGEGDDTYNIAGVMRGASAIQSGAGNDTINVGSISDVGGDKLFGTIDAGDGNDTINVGHSNPTNTYKGMSGGAVIGGAGDDKITVDLFSQDANLKVVDGGTGADTFAYGGYTTTRNVNTVTNTSMQLGSTGSVTVNAASTDIYGRIITNNAVTTAKIVNMEGIAGGAGNDTLDASYFSNKAATGYDTGEGMVYGAKLDGGAGNDTLIGGKGNDTMTGGAGNDTFAWRSGQMGGTATITDFSVTQGDKLYLGGLTSTGSTVTATDNGNGTTTFKVTNGSVTQTLIINSNSGLTTANFFSSGVTNVAPTDLNKFTTDNATATGGVYYADSLESGDEALGYKDGTGNDAINVTNMSGSAVYGGGGKDNINVSALSGGIVYGGVDQKNEGTLGGDDTITVGTMSGSATRIYAGDGTDTINVNNLTGGRVYGGAGGDTLNVTTLNNDRIFGDDDSVTKTAGTYGNDTINVGTMTGAGARIFGGFGTDTITVTKLEGGNIWGDGGTDDATGDVDTINVTTMSGGNIYAEGGDDKITVGTMTATAGEITGGHGNDTITVGTMQGGTIYGDTYTEDASKVRSGVGDGTDTINVTNMKGGTIDGGAGNDTITLGAMSGGDVKGGAGNDTFILSGAAGAYTAGTIDGGDGTNTLKLSQNATLTCVNGALKINGVTVTNIQTLEVVGTSVMLNVDLTPAELAELGVAVTGTGAASYNYAIENATGTISGTNMHAGSISGDGSDNTISMTGKFAGGTLSGGAGDDAVTVGTMTGGTIDGGEGKDTVSVTTMSGGTINAGAGDDNITVGTMNNAAAKIDAGAGNDTIAMTTLSAGTVDSGAGNDNITVTALSGGTINAGDGDDKITVKTMTSGTIDGGTGNNTIELQSSTTLTCTGTAPNLIWKIGGVTVSNVQNLTLAAGVTLSVTLPDATTSMPFSVTGGSVTYQWTTISGGSIDGDANANTITVTGAMSGGAINAGAGNDTVNVIGAMSGGTISGEAGTDTITVASMTGGTIDGGADNDTLKVTGAMSAGTIMGGDGVDNVTVGTLSGTAKIDGGAGDDNITAGTLSGTAKIDGGAGVDTINVTTMSGGTIDGGAGIDNVNVTNMSSGTINADGDTVKVTGTMSGGTILGDASADNVTVGAMTGGTINAGDGNDAITVSAMSNAAAKVYGDAGNDTITVTTMSAGTIDGGAGDDIVKVTGTLSGTTTISGGAGNDIFVYGGTAARTLTLGATGAVTGVTGATITGFEGIGGGTANDTLNASAYKGAAVAWDASGNATQWAGATIIGGGGNDTITGGVGNDTISVSSVSTTVGTIDGGAGNDVFIYDNAGNDVITLTEAGTVQINATTYANIKGFEGIGGGAGDDTLTGNSGDNTLFGGAGNDTLRGGAGNDILHGDAGNNTLYGGDGNDFIIGGTMSVGESHATVYGMGFDASGNINTDTSALHSWAEHLTFSATDGTNTLYGGDGNDILIGGHGNDTLYGGDGNDILIGGGGNDTLYGDAGNDILYGGHGNNVLDGGAGNDILISGHGNDTLTGGAGDDLFIIGAHHGTTTTITDFGTTGSDSLDLTAFQGGDYTITANADVHGTGTVLSIHDTLGSEVQTIHLEGYDISNFGDGDSAQATLDHAINNSGTGYIKV